MAKLFYDKDIDDQILRDKRISVIGYGSQGHACLLYTSDAADE